MNSCRTCKNLYSYLEGEAYWTDYPIKFYGCLVKPQVANLRSFPFKNTKCTKWEAIKELAGQPITGGASPPVGQIRL